MKTCELILCVLFIPAVFTSCTQKGTGSQTRPYPYPTRISDTALETPIAFEAVIVNRSGGKCIELSVPEEFEKYAGDGKWAITSKLAEGFDPEFLAKESRAIVRGKFVFVKDLDDGPCGLVTGRLFEISLIEHVE